MENSVAIATELTVTALREYTYGLPPGTLLDQFEALLSGLINGKIAIKDLEKANNDAASAEQARQDNMKPFILAGVDNLPGFVAKKKTLAIDKAYYTKIMLRALGEYEEDLYDGQVSPIKGVDCQTLINDVKEFRDKLTSGKMVLVEDTEKWLACEKKTKEPASETCGHKLEKETKLIKQLLRSCELTGSTASFFDHYSTSDRHSNEVRELSKKLFNGDIILVENPEKFNYIGEGISAGKAVVNEFNKKSVRKSSYSAFWRRLRRIKSRRNRKSIVKVLTETTIEEFEAQLTKHTNDGYKIKYVNINTKADNSGSGVRYYAVVQRS